ncbi:MAG: NAD(P)-dependent oxidoreductase [Myxococcales bacterium]|nr:NAD(P)-dependent oxidoreductase [Myxococcales bacterium]MCB9715218.1 NAD(P)-dependent oxidoreductase [Myxococcales bacterium]
MSKIAKERAESVFTDFKAAYTPQQALVEANRCLFCSDAPCIQACPTGIDIPQFIRKIATANVKGSARTIFDSNILGMSCARVCPVEVLCVGKCVYGEMGVPPIQIGKLQRYATDIAFEQGWRFFTAGPDSGKSVGLVGAGPASLAAAHELRRHGHGCTIYDKRPVVGGLNTTGVAPYKMRADRSEQEVEWVLGIGGIAVESGVEVGKDLAWDELRSRHDALFLGVGLGPDTLMDVPGADLDGIHGAVELIERFKLGAVDLQGVERAVVVGGGNTAVDAVRELRGLGVAEVTMLYRGTEPKMSGYAHEWSAAKDQGVRAHWQAQPVAFEGAGRVERIRCLRLDDRKQPIAGSEHVVEADLVLLAIGQSKLESLLQGLPGLSFERGRVVVDEHQATTAPGVYAGGDCANGGKEVVNAAAEGKRAALAIHAFLGGS